jgi:5-formyltetrahydrofolate cyclo-ligase
MTANAAFRHNGTCAFFFLTGGLDVIACPGLAFSETFFRLGRGKGYYDRYIYNCHRQQCQPFLVGLAFNEQMTGTNLALSERDQQLSLILYPDFYTSRRQGVDETKRQLRPVFRYTFPDGQ